MSEGEGEKADNKVAAILGDDTSLLICNFVAAVAVMVQASIDCDRMNERNDLNGKTNCRGNLAYAVAVGALGAVIVLVYMLLVKFVSLPAKGKVFMTVVLFIWWSMGAFIITFDGPYLITSNAYFGTWVAWTTSAVLLSNSFSEVQGAVSRFQALGKSVGMLFLGSAVELAASISYCSEGSGICVDYAAYALACGVVSLVVVMLMILVPSLAEHKRVIGLFMVAWWVAGAGINTFAGIFKITGNGYFASWMSLVAAVGLLQEA